ncbi:hypothetical protein PVAP13_5KG309677 [Panicum virgatum]|uniref:Uncharacterized protein n=1 Tax=Panicum virgatum TaxID=38727 RepID=A0A8T0SLT1_PANVG|nr:hypothetical protein PVAP13_5KG309677 [Panicum virgatum]
MPSAPPPPSECPLIALVAGSIQRAPSPTPYADVIILFLLTSESLLILHTLVSYYI